MENLYQKYIRCRDNFAIAASRCEDEKMKAVWIINIGIINIKIQKLMNQSVKEVEKRKK